MRLVIAVVVLAALSPCVHAQPTVDVVAPAAYTQYRPPVATNGATSIAYGSPLAYPEGTMYDARGEVFYGEVPDPGLPCGDRLYPVRVAGMADGTMYGPINMRWLGGLVHGGTSHTADYLLWATQQGGYCNSAGLLLYAGVTSSNDDFIAATQHTVEGARVDSAWDGIRIGGDNCLRNPGLCQHQVTGSWVSNARDDCIESDSMGGLEVSDTLLENCFAGISSVVVCTSCPDHSQGDEIVVHNTLLRLHAWPYGHVSAGSNNAYHVGPFKLGPKSPGVVVTDTIIAFDDYDQVAGATQSNYGAWATSWSKIKSCSNNYLLWMRDDPFPSHMPPAPACFTILTGQSARDFWAGARYHWLTSHPNVARLPGE